MDRNLIIVGGGYSVKEGIDAGLWEKIQHKEVWSLNYAFLFMPFIPSAVVWKDYPFFEQCRSELESLRSKGCKFLAGYEYGFQYEDLDWIDRYKIDPLKQEVNVIFTGRRGWCGIFALDLALVLGYKSVYLLGYDLREDVLKTHWYQDVSDVNSAVGRPKMYVNNDGGLQDFERFVNQANIINVNPSSRIECLKKVDYRQFFKLIG